MSSLPASLATLLAVAQLGPAEVPELPTPVVALEWTAPPGCPTAEAIERRIVELVGRPLGADPTRVLSVTAGITREAEGFVLELALRQPDGTAVSRRLTAELCAELAEPAAVVVAIAVVPSSEGSPRIVVPPSPSPSPSPASSSPSSTSTPPRSASATPTSALDPIGPAADTTPSPSATPTATRSRRTTRRPPPRGVLGAYGGIAGGVLPSLGGTLQLDLGLAFDALRIDLVVTHEFSRRVAREPGGGQFDLTAIKPEVCWTPGRDRWRIPLCGGPELGVLRAGGFGVDVTRRVRHVWVAISAGAGVTVALHRFVGLRLRTDLVVAPLLREFTLDGARLSRTGPLGARATLGVEAWFP